MQLAILMVMLMLIGQNNFSQIKPIIEQFGGDEGKKAIEQAEELNQIITTVKTLTAPQSGGEQPQKEREEQLSKEDSEQPPKTEEQPIQTSHPLDPIRNIADNRTLTAFSTYIALGE